MSYQVSLTSIPSLFAPGGVEVVTFDVTPGVSVNGSVAFQQLSVTQMPGSYQVFERTESRTISITGKFISRNVAEAYVNSRRVQTLQAWRYPNFGGRFNAQEGLTELSPEQRNAIRQSQDFLGKTLGAPPPVLYLTAYGSNNDTQPINIQRLPCVLTSVNVTFPEDVDYIPVGFFSDTLKEWFVDPVNKPIPIRMDVSLELTETHSPDQYSAFNLDDFKLGILQGF